MPATPTVSMCAFSISERPPPRPARDGDDVRSPGRGLGERRLESGALAPLRDEARDARSPEPPATSPG